MLGFLLILGQAIFTYGIIVHSFLWLYVGRILVGWGIESILPKQTTFIAPYYKDGYLSFNVGLNEFFATMGTILCIWYAPEYADNNGLVMTFGVGIALNFFSFIFSIVAVLLDINAEKTLEYQLLP